MSWCCLARWGYVADGREDHVKGELKGGVGFIMSGLCVCFLNRWFSVQIKVIYTTAGPVWYEFRNFAHRWLLKLLIYIHFYFLVCVILITVNMTVYSKHLSLGCNLSQLYEIYKMNGSKIIVSLEVHFCTWNYCETVWSICNTWGIFFLSFWSSML